MIAERRPATTIGELDIHLGFLMEELKEIRQQHDRMLQMLATKQELAEHVRVLNGRIDDNSPKKFWRSLTEIAVGVVALCTAAGFVIAVFRFLKLGT